MDNTDNRNPKPDSDLNEQKKNPPTKKSPWRFLFAGCAVYGALQLLGGLLTLVLPFFFRLQMNVSHSNAATIGIIGGADGPTAIFVTSAPWTGYILPAIALIAGIWGYYRLSKPKQT